VIKKEEGEEEEVEEGQQNAYLHVDPRVTEKENRVILKNEGLIVKEELANGCGRRGLRSPIVRTASFLFDRRTAMTMLLLAFANA